MSNIDKMSAKMSAWVNRDDPAVAMLLMHVSGDRSSIVEKISPLPENGDVSRMVPIAREVIKIAEADCAGVEGVHQFRLHAMTEADDLVSRFSFHLSAEEASLDGHGDSLSEQPTPMGHVGQMMRHNEAYAKAALATLTRTNDKLIQQNQTLITTVNDMLAQRVAEAAEIERLRSEEHERHLLSEIALHRQKRTDELFNKGTLLFPILANKLAGRKVLPEPVSPLLDGLGEFAKSLSDEQKLKMAMVLKTEQKLAFKDFMDAVEQYHDEEIVPVTTPGDKADGKDETSAAQGSNGV